MLQRGTSIVDGALPGKLERDCKICITLCTTFGLLLIILIAGRKGLSCNTDLLKVGLGPQVMAPKWCSEQFPWEEGLSDRVTALQLLGKNFLQSPHVLNCIGSFAGLLECKAICKWPRGCSVWSGCLQPSIRRVDSGQYSGHALQICQKWHAFKVNKALLVPLSKNCCKSWPFTYWVIDNLTASPTAGRVTKWLIK